MGIHLNTAPKSPSGGQCDRLGPGMRSGCMAHPMVQSECQAAALVAGQGKFRRRRRSGGCSGQGFELGIQGVHAVGLQPSEVLARVTQTMQHGLHLGHLVLHRLSVLRRLFVGGQHHHLGSTKSQHGQPHIGTHTGGVPQRHGDDPGRQTMGALKLGCTAQLVEHGLTLALAVQQQYRVLAASAGIGAEQCFGRHPQGTGLGIGIGQCTRGTHRGASPATDTQMGIDLDLLARGFR